MGPQVSWPFFNYGRIENNVRVQDARFQELLVTYHDTVIKAAQEVEDALAGYLNGQEATVFEQGAVKAAQSGRSSCRSSSTAKARSTTSACSTRSARCSQQQNDLAQTAVVRRHELDRALQGAGRRLGAGSGTARRARDDADRDAGAHELGRRAVAAALAGDQRARASGNALRGVRHGSKKLSKRARKWVIAASALAVVAIAVIGFRYWKQKQNELPAGIVSGNGRVEAKLVDVAAKEPLRVKEILVDEGAVVKPGQVLVRLDTVTLESQLAEAKANIDAAREKLAGAQASIAKQHSEIDLAETEANRSSKLVAEGAGAQRELDVRTTKVDTTRATLSEAQADAADRQQEVEVARANAATIQTRIDDATLKSPVTGRVLYRLAEAGEVLAPGGKALTIVNLEDVYMEIFLPAEQAAAVKLGAEGRITVDYDAKHAVAGYVSFVSPEAQFTPKQVETKSEREKLMFRVKIQVPKEVASHYIERIKTGVRGVGYVKTDPAAVWPARLQHLIGPTVSTAASTTTSPSATTE